MASQPPPSTWSITGDQLTIQCVQVLDAEAARQLLALVRPSLANGKIKTVVVNTNSVTDCPEAARKELVLLQQELGALGRRTAWIDARARFRGLALWVMHLANDQLSKAVSTPEQAESWLRSRELREAQASARTVAR